MFGQIYFLRQCFWNVKSSTELRIIFFFQQTTSEFSHSLRRVCRFDCTVCCLCVMPRTKGLAEGQWAEWGAPTGRHCAWVHSRRVTVGEYSDIKQHHSGLCALTQGTLCTFLQGWGDEGESEWEALVVVVAVGMAGRRDSVTVLAACCLNCNSCFEIVVSFGRSCGKHNGKTSASKQ